MNTTPTLEQLLAAMLRKQYYVVESRLVGSSEAMKAGLVDHLLYMIDLEKKGLVLASGPFTNDEGQPDGAGLTVLRVGSRAEAVEIAQADPLVTLGVRAVNVKAWTVNEGRFQISVNLSDGTGTVE